MPKTIEAYRIRVIVVTGLKRCSHCARHRTTADDIVRCRAQCEHRLTVLVGTHQHCCSGRRYIDIDLFNTFSVTQQSQTQ